MRAIPAPPGLDTDVSIDPKAGRIARRLYSFFADLIAALNNRVPITGSVTFAAATTAAVTFDKPEAADTYKVFFDSPEDNFLWATSRTTTGFTANAKNSTSETFGWQIIRA